MKTLKYTLAAGFIALSIGAMAQTKINQNISTDNNKIRIHVEKEENGKKEVFDKTFDATNMSNAERQAMIDRIADSLSAHGNKNTKMRIKVDKDSDPKVYRYKKDGKDAEVVIRKRYQGQGKSDLDKDMEREITIESDNDEDITIDLGGMDFDFKDLEHNLGEMGKTLKFKFDEFGPKMEQWGKDFEREFGPKMEKWGKDFERQFKSGDFHVDMGNTSSKTVKSLNAYPNKPNNGKLNVKFMAPEKGDITITVTDLNGKVVGQEKIKDFSGEYMSQVDLKGSVKGTLFVTVTQGEDGAVRRIVLE